MAKFTFTAESDDLHEIAHLINGALGSTKPAPVETGVVRGSAAEEAAAPVDAKPARTRKSKAEESPAAPEPEAAETPTAPEEPAVPTSSAPGAPSDEEHPLLVEVTLEDLKNKASALLAKSPKNGAVVMSKLADLFGAKAFSQVKVEDYGRCLAMLEEL